MFGFFKKKEKADQTQNESVQQIKSMKKLSCITDKPLVSHAQDRLSAINYANALYKFISHADTPVTIGVQGGWGSGKTSLISILGEKLSNDSEHKSLSVFVNAWEHSLFQASENKSDVALSLLGGLAGGIKEALERAKNEGWIDPNVVKSVSEDKSKFINMAIGGIKGALRISGGIALQMALNQIAGPDAGKVKLAGAAASANAANAENTVPSLAKNVRDLKQGLTDMIETVTKSGKPDRIVFFIDDLDRVSPPTAVEILDITKNIFDIPNCIFVLAIDYEVVVKGLEEKYGAKTAQNEREFRQYFDKIIQIPFTMPIGVYASHINDMLKPALIQLGYDIDEDCNELLNKLSNEAYFATNGTPRSIKRIINTLSLLEYISETNSPEHNNDNKLAELEIRFIIVALHISYPEICRRVMENSNFTAWSFKNLENAWKLDRKVNEQDLTVLESSEFFNDEWEKVLYCLCVKSPWLKDQSKNISQLLNALRIALKADSDKSIPSDSLALLEDVIASIRVVSIDNNTASQKIDESSIKTDRVTVFCQNLHKELNTLLPDIIPVPKKEYCKRSGESGIRNYEIIVNADSLSAVCLSWSKPDSGFAVSAGAAGNWKKQSDAKPTLKKLAGDFDMEQIGKDFVYSTAWEIDYDFFLEMPPEDMLKEIKKLCETTMKAYEKLNKN